MHDNCSWVDEWIWIGRRREGWMEKMRERMIFDFSPPGREVVLVGGERIWHLAARLKHRKKKQS
jgi:hypothetical protein